MAKKKTENILSKATDAAETARDAVRTPARGPKAKGTISRKMSMWRRDSNVRIAVIIALLLIVAALFFFWGKFRIVLAGIFVALMVALGMEISGNDWDLGKLWETGSLEESKVQRTVDGFWVMGDECNGEIDYNCDNFEYREDAQAFFEQCGGVANDVSKLDGDGDGEACESLRLSPTN